MKNGCYTEALKSDYPHRVPKVRGSCGPCSFINLTGMQGSLELEEKLSKLGRIKPYYFSDFTSFLVWKHKFNKKIEVFIVKSELQKEQLPYMDKLGRNHFYERHIFRWIAKGIHKRRVKKFKDEFKIIRNPLAKLDQLLKEGNRVAMLVADFYSPPCDKIYPHWVVVYKKENNKYYFCDPEIGKFHLDKKTLLRSWEVDQGFGFYPELIAYKD